MNKTPGVYAITNTINGKVYIGSTVNLDRRCKAHIRMLRAGTHHSPKLQAAWNKHGESVFTFTILSECSRELCGLIEQTMIDKFDAANSGYNIQPKVFITPDDICKSQAASNKPKPVRPPCSEETKKKISQANKGNQAWVGRHHSEETKAKLRADRTGVAMVKCHTAETRAKMSAARKAFWSDPEKEEQRKSMTANLKLQNEIRVPTPRKLHSEETKAKIVASQKLFQETKRKAKKLEEEQSSSNPPQPDLQD